MIQQLHLEFEKMSTLKKSQRSEIYLLRHKTTGNKFVLRYLEGGNTVYHSLLNSHCPYLPDILETSSQGSHSLVLEEYVQGDCLHELLKDSLFSPREVKNVIRDVCRGLWVLHSLGAVHRDVKPENIIMRGNDAVLIDFDAARMVNSNQNNDTMILGTTGFAAPEQYGFSQSDPRADVYSVGILINIMLTGRHPSNQLAKGHWGTLITKCTQVNPNDRYQNMRQLIQAL